MYIDSSMKIEMVLSAPTTTTTLKFNTSYCDIASTGLEFPTFAGQGASNNTTDVDVITAPTAGKSRLIKGMSFMNTDSVSAFITVKKDVGGTEYPLASALLQVGDTLQYTDTGAWSINKVSSQESVLMTAFTASGTWTKQAGLKRILGAFFGAGGGSGSGRRGAAGTNRFGGGGSGGGEGVWLSLAADALPSTVAVTIGSGGTGGAAVTVDDTNGNPGTAGGDTSFGAIAIAKGGAFGGGGSTAAGALGAGGAVATGNPQYGPFCLPGANGAAGNTITTAAGATGFIGTTACPGGGGGGGINSSNTVGVAAMTGGAIYQNGVLQAGPVSGASPNGVDDKSVFLHFSTTLTSGYGPGTGGAGGVPATPNGGNGGRCAGAGGGAGVLNGTNSGAGATGGDGLAVIMEFY